MDMRDLADRILETAPIHEAPGHRVIVDPVSNSVIVRCGSRELHLSPTELTEIAIACGLTDESE